MRGIPFTEMTIVPDSSPHKKRHVAGSEKKERVKQLTKIELHEQKRMHFGEAMNLTVSLAVAWFRIRAFYLRVSRALENQPYYYKRALLLQRKLKKNVVYITAEESLEQIRERSIRLGINVENIYVIAESN